MTRPLRKHKLWAELLVAALLTYVTLDQCDRPTIENLHRLQLDGLKLRVAGSPDAFVALIKLCSELPSFNQKQRKNLAAFYKLLFKEQYDAIRDSITTLGKYRLIQERTPRKRGDPNRNRDFVLFLPLAPTSAENQAAILKHLFAPGQLWDQEKSASKSTVKQKHLKEAADPILKAKQALSEAIAASVIPHLPDQLSEYTSETLTSLTELITILETATRLTESVDLNHHSALLVSLGRVYLAQQQRDLAKTLFEQVLIHARNPLAMADSLHWLGIIHHQSGNYSQAQKYYSDGLEQRTQLLGKKHPDVAASTHALAELYSDIGQLSEAENFFDQACSLYKEIYGKTHPQLACVLNGLATFYIKLNQLKEAESRYEEAFKILSLQADSDTYPYLTDSQHGLANLYTRQGKYEKAEKMHQDAIEAIEHLYGVNHPNLAVHKASLAVTYRALRRLEEAKTLYVECINSLISAYGNTHPQVAIYLSDLAWLIAEESINFQELGLAQSFFQKSINILSQVFTPDHPSLINAQKGLNLLSARIAMTETE